MAFAAFGNPPPGVIVNTTTLTPYKFSISNDQVTQLTDLLRATSSLSSFATPSYFNTHTNPTSLNGTLGVSLDWLVKATEVWTNEFDWRKVEGRLNRVPNFVATVTVSASNSSSSPSTPTAGGTPSSNTTATASGTNAGSGSTSGSESKSGSEEKRKHKVHFAALFSHRQDAVPLLLLHGWPGAWFEFLPVMERLAQRYTPETLPFHVVVPSLPGFGISSSPPEKEMTFAEAAAVVDALMTQLGMGDGYVVQGGDVGSLVAMVLGGSMPACKAVHVNMVATNPAWMEVVAGLEVTPEEAVRLARMQEFVKSGRAYQVIQGERPATVGFAVMSSPVAMLAWIGEKILEWSDSRSPIPLDEVLAIVSFYWFTKSFGTSIWPYRASQLGLGGGIQGFPSIGNKPVGFSGFPFELFPIPKSWAEKLFPGMVFYRSHDMGGHFAALEQPDGYLKDVEDFVALVKKDVKASISA